jgi:predicted TIM-barrel fold metal-dependent hydrolase
VAYAEGRTYFDADSHVMELPDFLTRHAPPAIARELLPLNTEAAGAVGAAVEGYARTRTHTPEQLAVLEQDVMGAGKGYDALGAFDPAERAHALDLLGFHAQLVFGTFSLEPFLHHPRLDVRYAGCRAANRAMVEFCADDPRLLPVGVVSLADPTLARREVEAAVAMGCAAVWVPAEPCGGRSPGHVDLDPVWAVLAEAAVPFVLHVGAQPIAIDDAYMRTGRPVAPGFAGGGEALRTKDFPLLHQSSEAFLSVLVLDGVLDRHPALRGAAVELGASWAPGLVHRLDDAFDHVARHDPFVRAFSRRPSDQVRDQLAFTPFSFEDVGALIAASWPELYLFSSDYPHVEGGRNPLGRFERSLAAVDEATRTAFYSGNLVRILPRVAELAPR